LPSRNSSSATARFVLSTSTSPFEYSSRVTSPSLCICRQMKGLANDLCYLDEPVSNRTLVLNLLRSLGGATTTYGLGSCGSFRSPLSRRSGTTSSLRSSIRGPRFLPPLQQLSIASFLVGCLSAPYSPYWLTLHSYPPGPCRLVLLPLLALLPAMVGTTDYSIILQ
jgi:hypothetical protein